MAQLQTIKAGKHTVSIPTGIFINNEFRKALGGNQFGVENPATGEEILKIEEGREDDVDEAVRVALKTFKSAEW